MPGGLSGASPLTLLPLPRCPALAMKHMDLKQMELDTAAAKVDELTKQLESLWSDSPTPPGSQAGAPARVSLEFRHTAVQVVGYRRVLEREDQGKWTFNRNSRRKRVFF